VLRTIRTQASVVLFPPFGRSASSLINQNLKLRQWSGRFVEARWICKEKSV
jgi:hypothetical protein